MKVKSFRIKNYRSIIDSKECYLDNNNITILAGKNESGKTAILEALEDFNVDKEIRGDAKPLSTDNAEPYITITFEISKIELSKIYREMGIKRDSVEDGLVKICKIYPNYYNFSEDTVKNLDFTDINENIQIKKESILEIIDNLIDIRKEYPVIDILPPKYNKMDIGSFKQSIRNFADNYEPIISANIADEKERKKYLKKINNIRNFLNEYEELSYFESKLLEKFKSLIPNFILFTSFEDIFPSTITFGDALNNNLVQDLEIISKLDLELIKSKKDSQKMEHKQKLNIKVKREYRRFWQQDFTNLHIDWDSNNLLFWFKEDNKFFPPKYRSKGKQWHLAFYIRVSARAKENKNNIILIDEPGLFLHAKAQKDVLNKLEDVSKYSTIIFSTHSPYLIDIYNLSRIRLITKDGKTGTIISNKIQKNADIETLTPIITAIGLDLSLGLDISKENNVLLEGISDYYYICAFKEIIKYDFKKDIHIIPCQGAGKARILAPLLIGWGLNFCVVFDNDNEGKKEKERFEKDFKHLDIKILTISERTNEEIEDLFDRKDFVKHLLCLDVDNLPKNKSNSQIIKQKDKKFDMVLKSKLFFEKSKKESIELTEKTRKNFSSLLEKIDDKLFSKK